MTNKGQRRSADMVNTGKHTRNVITSTILHPAYVGKFLDSQHCFGGALKYYYWKLITACLEGEVTKFQTVYQYPDSLSKLSKSTHTIACDDRYVQMSSLMYPAQSS